MNKKSKIGIIIIIYIKKSKKRGEKMEKEKPMLSILKGSGMVLDDNLSNCKLNCVKANDDTSSWRFCITLDNIITCEKLKELNVNILIKLLILRMLNLQLNIHKKLKKTMNLLRPN